MESPGETTSTETAVALPEPARIAVPERIRAVLEDEGRALASDDEFIFAARALVEVRRARHAVEDELEDDIAAKHRAHKAAVAERKRRSEELDRLEPVLAAKLGRWLEGHAELDGGDLVVPATAVPLVEGFGWSIQYRSVVEDFAKLVRAATRKGNERLLELLVPNEKELNARAKRQREAFRVPGCRLEARVVPVVATADVDNVEA